MIKARQSARAEARPRNTHIPNAICAELIGSDTANAASISVTAYGPVLELCRRLIDAGHDPTTPLHAYRGLTLCLKVRSIGEAARLRISPAGVGFKRLPPPRGSGASPIAQKRRAVGGEGPHERYRSRRRPRASTGVSPRRRRAAHGHWLARAMSAEHFTSKKAHANGS